MSPLYAGLDVSEAATAICVVDDLANRILETETETRPEAIAGALRPYRRRLRVVAQETGTLAPWLHQELLRRKLPAVCLDARTTRFALRGQRNKTDKNDARDIAALVCRGLDNKVHMKSDEARRVRFILTLRRCLRRKARDVEVTLATALKGFGLGVPPAADPQRSRAAPLDPLALAAVRSMGKASEALRLELATFDKMVSKMAAGDPVCRRLMTVPGVGPITALTYKAAVDDPRRFAHSRIAGAHFGLTPREFQSGGKDVRRPISRLGDFDVRCALYEAAMSMLVRSKTDSSLKQWGMNLARRRGYKFAAVACARKLAVLLHRMWVTETDFHPQQGGAT